MRSRHRTARRIAAFAIAVSVVLPAPAAAADEVLYGNIDGDSYGFMVSQNMSSEDATAAKDLGRYESRAADDFEVPARTTWKVSRIAVDGGWFRNVKVRDSPYTVYYRTQTVDWYGATETPVAVRVAIHADANGRPANLPLRTDGDGQACGTVKKWPLWSTLTGEEPLCRDSHGTLVKRYETPVALGPGRYWVSFQVVADPRTHGEWFWDAAGCPSFYRWDCYSGAHWQNPNGGYATDCTDWRPVYDCIWSYQSRNCATGNEVVESAPVCEERRPYVRYAPYGDLSLIVIGTATRVRKQ